MLKKDCFYLGKIAKKFSFKGEVVLFLDTDEPEAYENLESVFVELSNDNLIPSIIESAQLHRNHFLRVRFEDIDTETDVDEIIGAARYLPLSKLPKLEDHKFYSHEVIGFAAKDHS